MAWCLYSHRPWRHKVNLKKIRMWMDKREFIFLQSSDISMGLMDSNLQRQIEEIKNTVPKATAVLELPRFPGFHIIIYTNVGPFLPLWSTHMLFFAFWLLIPSFSPQHSIADCDSPPSIALLTLKVRPGEANPRHSCSPKEINKWILFPSYWP